MTGVVTIGRFAELAGLTVKTLHHYDAIHLLRPHHVDSVTGYRSYRVTQVREATIIKTLRGLGMSLDEVADVLRSWGDAASVRARLEDHRGRLEAEFATAKDRLSFIDLLLQGADMPYEVTTKRLDPTPAVLVRTVMKLDELGLVEGRRTSAVFEQVAEFLNAEGVEWTRSGILVTHGFGDDHRDSSYGFPVSSPVTTRGLFSYEVLAGGEFLSVTHIGPIEQVHPAFAAMEEAVQEREVTTIGPWRLIGHGDPSIVEPRQQRSEVLARIA